MGKKAKMERVKLQKGLSVSRIIYGMWRLGDDKNTSEKHVRAKIETFLAQGITTIDQADIYGGYTAEAILGKCFKASPKLRDKLEIITKCDIVAPAGRHSDARVKYYDTSAKHIENSINYSLKEMNIGQIDLLLIHRPDPMMDHFETGKALDKAIKSGKVRAVGVSNFKPHDWTLLQSAMKTKLVTNQIELSVLAHDGFTNGDIAFLQERGIPPMAWSPLGGGNLFIAKHRKLLSKLEAIGKEAGTDAAAVATAWLLAHPSKILPVMGTNNLDRIKSFSDALKVELDRECWFQIYTAAQGYEVP